MSEVTTIGLDLAKSVFQVHGVDELGETVVCRQLRRRQVLPFFKKQAPCLVGLEACASAHHWAREISALGHEVRMMPARYVKPYVKRNQTSRDFLTFAERQRPPGASSGSRADPTCGLDVAENARRRLAKLTTNRTQALTLAPAIP